MHACLTSKVWPWGFSWIPGQSLSICQFRLFLLHTQSCFQAYLSLSRWLLYRQIMSYCSSTVISVDVQNCFGIKLVLKSGQHLDFNAALLTFEMVASQRCRHASPVQRSWGRDCSGSGWGICPLPHYTPRAPWSPLGTSSQEEVSLWAGEWEEGFRGGRAVSRCWRMQRIACSFGQNLHQC